MYNNGQQGKSGANLHGLFPVIELKGGKFSHTLSQSSALPPRMKDSAVLFTLYGTARRNADRKGISWLSFEQFREGLRICASAPKEVIGESAS
jgi:hypothetical protein